MGCVSKAHEVWPLETHYQRSFSNMFYFNISLWFLRVLNTWFFSFKSIPVRLWVTSIPWNKPWYEERFHTRVVRGEEHEREPEVLEREVLPDVPQWTIWHLHLVWLRAEGRPAKHRPYPQLMSAYSDPARRRVWALSHLVTSGVDMAMAGPPGHPRLPLYGTPPAHRRQQSRPELPCIVSLYLHVSGFQLPTLSFS